ncbi:MAG: LysR family transcriptional regulator [Mesosutterella sp.]|nr:LysR family transcriptional regulator [Mesosutterella sp.]
MRPPVLKASPERLRVFLEVSRAGSMSGAARKLFLTQSAVSHAVAKLEDELGFPLFARSGKRLAITREGEELRSALLQGEEALLEAGKRIASLRALERGRLRFTVPVLLLHFIFMRSVASFHEAHPGVELEIRVENHESELIRRLRSGEADIVAVTTPHPEVFESEFETARLGSYCYGFSARPDRFPGLFGHEVTLAELNRQPLAALTKGHVARDALEAEFSKVGLSMNVRFECETMALVDDFSRAGLGVGMTITGCEPKEPGPRLEPVKLPPLCPGVLVAAVRKGGAVPGPAGEFLRQLVKASEGQGPDGSF